MALFYNVPFLQEHFLSFFYLELFHSRNLNVMKVRIGDHMSKSNANKFYLHKKLRRENDYTAKLMFNIRAYHFVRVDLVGNSIHHSSGDPHFCTTLGLTKQFLRSQSLAIQSITRQWVLIFLKLL